MYYTIVKTDLGLLAIPSYYNFIEIKKCYPEYEVVGIKVLKSDISKDIKIIKNLY